MTVRSFFFIGGDPAIDLLNTEAAVDGEPADLLSDPESLTRWLAESGVMPAGGDVVRITPAMLKEVKTLRGALRSIAGAFAKGISPKATAFALIDEVLRRGEGALRLRHDAAGSRVEFEAGARAASDPRFVVARVIAEFLSHADSSRVRQCEGHGCVLFFYDVTRSGTRRWCSMAGCGNRAKAAAHYQRKRER